MHILKLRISDQVFDKLIWLLGKFSKEEVEIIDDDIEYQANKKYLHQEYREIMDGTADFINIQEAETRLEKIVKKHEDRS